MNKKTKKLHVGTSPLTNRIFAGHVLKDGHTWASNKTDVTGMACGAVCEHVIANGAPVTVMCNGKPRFEITVSDLDDRHPAGCIPQDEASGLLQMTLVADSGYTTSEKHQITPDQWGKIQAALHPETQKSKGVSFDLKIAMSGAHAFFEGEYFWLMGIVDSSQVKGQRQEDECKPEFDHCFVDQDGGGITGDDFHGCVYFHIGSGEYLKASY